MKRYALVVGIDRYKYLGHLAKAVYDAQQMHELLVEHGQFDEEPVLLLNEQATESALRQALETVLIKQGKQAEVLIYFAGHGFVAGKSEWEQQGYLATHDSKLQKERGELVAAEGSLPFVFLNGLIEKAELAGLAVFLDCCQSEYAIDEALLSSGLRGFREKAYFLSAACRGFAPAYEEREGPHGVYTGALRKALVVENADQKTGEISAADAHSEAVKQLKGTRQTPVQFGFGTSFSVVRYRQPAATERVGSEVCPYQGLAAFTPETVEFFFGRDAAVGLLLQKVGELKFVPVLGPSGSGKSSVVRAGLVTRLVAQGWRVMTMKPGSDPLGRLRSRLEQFLDEVGVATGGRRRLMTAFDEEGLLALARRLTDEVPTLSSVLLVVDQFEEVFTQCVAGKEASRDAFVRALVAVGEADTPLSIVMTMRSDFVNEWLATGQPPVVMSNQTVCLGPLQGDALRDAIVEPARLQGYELMPELLDLLLDDVKKEENCLPLLEFALTELWEKRDTDNRVLTAAAYREMGRLGGALNERAEKVFGDMRPEPEQVWARRICLQLVRIGPEKRDTRSRQRKADLLAMGEQAVPSNIRSDAPSNIRSDTQKQQIISDVIQDLVDGRLLVTGREEEDDVEYVDLSHEALLLGWQRFVAWRQADRDLLRLEQRIADAYEEWLKRESCDKDVREKYLLTGGLLAEVKEQQEALSSRLSESRPVLMKYFADSDRKEAETVAMLQRALADANMRAASLKVRDKLLNNPSQTVDAALAAMALVGKSQQDFQGDVVHPAQDALHRAWFKIRERLKLEGHSSWVNSVAFSPQGDRIVSGSADSTLRLWDLEGNAVGSPFEGHSSSVNSVAFSPQGDRIVSGSDDSTLRLWDLEGNAVGSPFEGHSSWVRSVAFSPQGDRIVSGSADSTLRLWDLEGNAVGSPFEGHSSSVNSVAFSPQGDRIVSGSDDKTLRLWDLEGNAVGSPFEGHSSSVYSVAFSPQGDRIVSGSDDKTLRLWDLEGNAVGSPFEGHSSWVYSVAFSPQGDRIVSGSDDSTLRLWDLEGNAVGSPFEGHSSWVNSVAFSPQGDRIVSGSADSTLRLWDLEGNAVGSPFEGHSSSVNSVAFSPQGDRIVSGSADSTLRLWDLEGNAVGSPFEGHSSWVNSVAFSPQGDRIVSGSADSTLRLWDLEGNAVGSPFEGHSSSVRSVAFSPQGDRIVSGSADKTLRLWDLEGNAVGSPFEGHSSSVSSVAFSPQGDRIVSGSYDNTLMLWRVGTWEDELRYCCNALMHHAALALPQTEVACEACEVCEQVWTRQQSATFAVAQGSALASRGEIEAAVEKFNRATELDPTLTLEPLKRANELAEWSKA